MGVNLWFMSIAFTPCSFICNQRNVHYLNEPNLTTIYRLAGIREGWGRGRGAF
jgi:hypothetical protein